MNNVEVADKMVEALKKFKIEFDNKDFVMIPHTDCEWYIKGLERLRMMERHLSNLQSRAYDITGQAEQDVQTV